MKTMSLKDSKRVKRQAQVAMLGLTLAGVATAPVLQVLADNSTTDTKTKADGATKKGLKVTPDASELNKAVKEAQDAGLTVTQDSSNKKQINAADVDKTQAEVKADYHVQADKLRQQVADYKAQKATYDEHKAQYDKDKAAFDAEEAAHAKEPGHPADTVLQQLMLSAENNAKMSGTNMTAAQGIYYDTVGNEGGSTPILVYRGYDKSDPSNNNANGVPTQWYHIRLNNGQTFKTTHENLENASYKGKKITKMVQTVKNDGNTSDSSMDIHVAADPTVGVWYNGSVNPEKGTERTITVTRTYYYADGSKVVFDDDNAYISVGSLNAGYQKPDGNSLHTEKSKVENGTFVPVNGGSIKPHDDGFDYADQNDWYTKDGTLFEYPFDGTWDADDSPNRYYGTAVYRLKAGTSEIKMTASTKSQPNDGNGTTWWTSSTTMPFRTAPVFNEKAPKKPELNYQLTDLYVTPKVTKDVDAGTNTGNIDGSADGQVFMTGDALSYSLSASPLPAGRDQYKSLAYEDPLPDGFSYTGAKAFDKDGKDISDQFTFSEKGGKFSATYTAEALKTINGNTDKETPIATIEVYGVAEKDGVKLANTYNLVVDGTNFESNEVESSVVDFQAHKDIESGVKDTATGQSIAGKAVKNGQKLTYELTADNLPANRAADINGLKWQDTLPDYVDYIGYKVVNADGKDVTDDYEYKGDNNRQFEIDKKSTDAENADKTTAYKNDTVLIYVKANQDGVDFKNTAHMVLNDNDKVTNTVTNSTSAAEKQATPVKEEAPAKELPNTGSTGLVQQAINWFVNLLK
ncbi:hypothetical protein K1728_06420 [Weissella confusa]|uniref:GbpC/Spa domain-containing protein n=1 Tax=Weissella confusa TaxID=1583 RepID=UPI001C6F6CA2|nr:GbpC/Spa domain-containing protein [Weissella confusa]QYU56826.1 hypothetical protein K1728_06420 [Weissella confusa]